MIHEKRGWIREWRQATDEDMYLLDPYAFKLWHYLLINAQHAKYRDLEPGDLTTTYQELRAGLRMRNGKTYSEHTIQECLLTLQDLGYIKILEAKRRTGIRIRIISWAEMQGNRSSDDDEFVREVTLLEAD